MQKKIYVTASKEELINKIFLNSVSRELALEEAVCRLRWIISQYYNEQYKTVMYRDEHMMSLFSQKKD